MEAEVILRLFFKSKRSKAKVVVVDDQNEKILALQAPVRKLDCKLIKFTSCEAALKYLELNEVAVVILSVKMPLMDGFEAAKRIRDISSGFEVPIIFVTDLERTEDVVGRGAQFSNVQFVYRPAAEKILASKVSLSIDSFYARSGSVPRESTLMSRISSIFG